MARIACIGAGLVGSAWATVFARGGHDVSVFDSAGGGAEERGLQAVARTLEILDRNGFLREPAETIRRRVTFTATLPEAVAGVVHVQESVKEDVAVKQSIFAEIAEHAPADAVLASSTSAIMGSRFLDVASPERALVVHPVNPPSLIPLVEICGTPATSQATVDRTVELMRSVGMKPVVLRKEIEGFLLNRLQYTLVAEAMHLVGEGYCTAEDIDSVVRDGLAMRWSTIGPFEVAHLNSPEGFSGFVHHLGDMMREMGRGARTDYPWTDEMAEGIHEQIAGRVAMSMLTRRQAWRDENILATRRVQDEAAARWEGP
ncbi:3-hydroxyacyl-CoA dehydrogenase NAD-binding domain-containing protein [Mesorhizobium yinganensis]|uniref:3-hydroxyacyl-CoA dehydrogenase NAD-binding domain-containing protein n=1 Tax=Mesorhizobium yinganensis TaxID=3157707 RepID=UPI0032B8512A